MTAATDPAASSSSRSAPLGGGRGATWRDLQELLSSMRFAISLLTVICIASVIGTVIQQRQPPINYVNQFGPFWSSVFERLDLYTVYGAWWFLLILAFLVVSTSLCIARNTPKILADLRTFKEGIRAQSLLAFRHKAQAVRGQESVAQAGARIQSQLVAAGWSLKVQPRELPGATEGLMLAAKRGGANKVGYILAHSAIVLICLGGLADGDLMVRVQMWMQGLEPYVPGSGADPEAPQHRLSAANPAFRANLDVSEGQRNRHAVIALADGLLLQPLPFEVELKKFRVDYYDTGMPKLFASDVVVHDGGQALPATIEVNKPFIHRGIAIYQSSFQDGGSRLKLRSWIMGSGQPGPDLNGTVGSQLDLAAGLPGARALKLELIDLRVINVENLGDEPTDAGSAPAATDPRRVDLGSRLAQHLGAGDKARRPRNLRNLGPAVVYKLRDAAGQAVEFQNYMLPAPLEGQAVFLLGQRKDPGEPFRYLRIPADENASLEGWMRMRAALADPQARAEAARRYVARSVAEGGADLARQLEQTAERALALFAGAEPARGADRPPGTPPSGPIGGLQALSDDIEAAVPPAQRDRAAEALIRVLNGALFELLNLSRESAGLAALQQDEATGAYLGQAVLSMSDAFFYEAPLLFMLADFQQVQASVFQVARAPGQKVVYLGCLLLVLGVFAMLYVRERRLWVWIEPDGGTGSRLQMALSCTRQTLDVDREFDDLKARLLEGADGPPGQLAAS